MAGPSAILIVSPDDYLLSQKAKEALDALVPEENRMFGLEIVDRVPIEVTPNPHNVRYLRTKREKMGHMLEADGLG